MAHAGNAGTCSQFTRRPKNLPSYRLCIWLSRLNIYKYASLISALLHHLIPGKTLSLKIPVTGRGFKESVKVCAPKSPSPTDDSPLNLAPGHVFAYGAGAQTEDLGGFSQREKVALIDCIFPFQVSFHYIPSRQGIHQFAFVAETLFGRMARGWRPLLRGQLVNPRVALLKLHTWVVATVSVRCYLAVSSDRNRENRLASTVGASTAL
jgi:hypothetical protein